MHAEQRARTRAEFEDRGFCRAVLANPAAITWLTGIPFRDIPGGSPFAGPPLVWFEDGAFTLVVSQGLEEKARAFCSENGCHTILYEGYTAEKPLTPLQNLARELAKLANGSKDEIAVETRDLPAYLLESIQGEIISIDGWSAPLRKVKTGEEIEKLRASFRLADVGQSASKAAVVDGASEMDVYLAAYDAIAQQSGETVYVGNDFVSSRRANNIGGPPSCRKLSKGDSIVVDISAVLEGYWSDSCATCFVSTPSNDQQRAVDTVARALALGTEMLCPGVKACEVDRAMKSVIREAGYSDYPHHGGHGIGVTAHEAPRIVGYNEEVLAENMVVMLEPGIYLPEELAVRLEHGVLVTADGPQLLGASAL